MQNYSIAEQTISVNGDISPEIAAKAEEFRIVGVDIETSGLDWTRDRIGVIQISVPSSLNVIVQISDRSPEHLLGLFFNPNILKVFHHAMFDMRFIMNRWDTQFKNVYCTKIASKLLQDSTNHKLQELLDRYLDVHISKDFQQSNWLRESLSKNQIAYASDDVKYLPRLYEILQEELKQSGLKWLSDSCFKFLPAKAYLDLRGYSGIFEY